MRNSLFVFALWLTVFANQPIRPLARAQTDLAPVVIALQDLPRGFQITDDVLGGANSPVGIVFYPAESVPAGALTRLEEVVGKWVRTDIPREMPISGYFLAPDLRQDPTAELPYPVSPPTYRVVRERTLYTEVTYDQPENLRFSPGLAAGDVVMVITSTGLGNIALDETSVLIEQAVIGFINEESITFSVTPEEAERLTAYLGTGFPITLAAYAPYDSVKVAYPTLVNFELLYTRPVNPLILPEGTDIVNVERVAAE